MMASKFPPKKPTTTHVIKVAPKHNWSEWQKNIFRNVAKNTGHLVVKAYAGAAKTTSIVESFKYVPKGKKTLCLAFNKIIQEELRARSPSYVETLTFHSLGYRAIRQRFGNAVTLDDNKTFTIVKGLLDDGTEKDLIANICDTVAFCKYGLIDVPKDIDAMMCEMGIDTCDLDRKIFIGTVIKVLGMCKLNTNVIDFNDMCWMPFVHNLFVGQYDYVYVDEAQDLNKSQLVMAKKACKPDGRIVVVKDDYQSLYSWRLADTSILQEIEKDPATSILQLPVSYRCPKEVVDLARAWVPDFMCPETAMDGEIKNISLNQLYTTAQPGCFVLSRTNAPLIKICMTFIRQGVRANIRGRDVGKQLNYLVKKSKKKKIDAFLKWLETWRNEEVAKLQEKNINTENVLDRYECLVSLCEECKSLEEVSKKVNELFDDTEEGNIIILSTVHRAKGLERKDVFVLRWTFRVWFDQMDMIDKPNEEANIAYVAVTRAKERLFIVRK